MPSVPEDVRAIPTATPTSARILDSAARLLAEHGYGGLRIQDVAAAADVRPAAIYYYFDSRDALVEEVLWSGMARLRLHVERTLRAVSSDAPVVDRLMTAVAEHLRYELEISDYTLASIRNAGQVAPPVRERQRREFVAYRELWLRLVDDAVTEAGARPHRHHRVFVMLAIGALNWAAEWFTRERHDLDEVIHHAQVLIRNGLLSGSALEPAEPSPTAGERPAPAGETPGGPTPTTGATTRDRILAATAATLRERGYAKSHLAEIAERAGVQAPAIYHYFRSRRDLMAAVLTTGQRAASDHMLAALETLPAGAGPRQRASVLADAHLRVALELSDFATAVTRNAGQVPPPLRALLVRETLRLSATWEATFVDAADRGELRHDLDPTLVRLLVMGALNWVPEWWRPDIAVDDVVSSAQRLIDAGPFASGAATGPSLTGRSAAS